MNMTMSFNVRNGKDPFLLAEFLTEHTFNFGMNAQDLRALGITLGLACTLLAIQPIFYLCRLRRSGPLKYDYFAKARDGY